MKRSSAFIAAALSAVLFIGCSASKKTQFKVSTELKAAEEQRTLPVLSIQTVSDDRKVMEFVRKPVAKHVSEQIASWTPNYEMPPEPYYEDCTVTLTGSDGTSLLASAEAKVKVRGNWTTTYDKKPLRIKFTEKQSLLGLNNGEAMKNWLLLAEYKDGSMLRNKAALYAALGLMEEDGLYAADSELVTVKINGEYFGVYLLSEMQQVSSHRVDITEPEKDYTGTDIGYFMEYDGYYSYEDELHGFSLDFADNAPLTPYDGSKDGGGRTMSPTPHRNEVGMTIKSTINSKEQHDFIESYVNNVYRIMYEAAYNDKAYAFSADYSSIAPADDMTPRQAVEKVVNVNSLADTYIISELTCDADIYWSSFYMDADFGPEGDGRLTFEAPWDFDSAMGNKDRCLDGKGFYAANIVPDVNGGSAVGGYDTINPWLAVLAYEDWYQDIVKEKWTKAYDSGLFTRTCQLVADDSQQLADEFDKNYSKWKNLTENRPFIDELSEPAKECRSQLDAGAFLIDWLNKRIDFLNSKWHK